MRIAGLACLGIPIAVLLLFAIGEIVGGDLSGSQHLLQLAPLLALAYAGWRWPYHAGMVLMVAGALLALAFVLFFHPEGISLTAMALVELVLFMPAIVAGAFLTLSGAIERGDFGDRDGDAQPSR